jgi:hypothetical protein
VKLDWHQNTKTDELPGSIAAADFFERCLRNRRTLVREGKIPSLTEQDCINQQALLERVLDDRDRNSTVFAINHGDVAPSNIIIDEDDNIKW